jgi:mannose-1-phosphate guanylyltransferase
MLNSNHYLVILSGGWGTRLWPLSTKGKPKQFLHINSNKSLIEQTLNLFGKLFIKKNIILVTGKQYKNISRKYWKNIIVEPKKKNTALAIFFATQAIYKKNKNAIISVIPSDHLYQNPKENLLLLAKCQLDCQKKPEHIYLLGQKPKKADKSFTYLVNKKTIITKIVEKPSLKYSQKLLNKSIISADTFTFSANLLVNITKSQNIDTNYKSAPAISFEKFLKNNIGILSIYSDEFEFVDLGEWKNVFDISPKNKEGIASNTNKLHHYKSNKSLVLSENKKKIYGLVGCENLAIIDTPNALLVCNLSNDLSYNVKDLVKKINEKK